MMVLNKSDVRRYPVWPYQSPPLSQMYHGILNLANKVRNWAEAEDAAEQLEQSDRAAVLAGPLERVICLCAENIEASEDLVLSE